jgi:hypothetical protein
MAEPHENLLRKADALLRRHRGRREVEYRDPPSDFPVLTEVVQDSQQVAETPPAAPEPAPSSLPPSSPLASSMSDADLAQLEQDLRFQLLELLGPEFERLIESKVHDRLGVKIDEVMTLTRTVIEAEVRAVIREALAEVIAAETERLRIELNLG